MKTRVIPATPYQFCQLGSLGKANLMLIRQFNFPDIYEDTLDKLVFVDHDRCFQFDHEHASHCFNKYVQRGERGFENWAREASDQKIINFLMEILKADQKINWTGYRIRGTVGGNGQAIFSLGLFAKHPESSTVVYTGEDAPNVVRQ